MKIALFLLAVSVCYAAEEKETYYYPKESSDIFLKAATKCIENFGYNSSVMDEIMQGKYIEEDNTLKVLMCAAVDTGYGYADGKLNLGKVIKELYPARQHVRPILEECNQEPATDTPLATFKAIVTCIQGNLPFNIRFPM